MADYWKSQPKYYCTACNCYMADNKVTRERHEGGKNHQENVERRLKEIRIKALQDEREKRILDNCFKQMNEGAAKSMAGKSDSIPTTTVGVAQAAAQSATLPATNSGYKRGDLASAATAAAAAAVEADISQDWRESKTADGRVYYWNTKTRETVWEKRQPKSASTSAENADNKPAVKSTKIRVLGSSGPPAAAAPAPVGPWTPVVSSSNSTVNQMSATSVAKPSDPAPTADLKRPSIISEKVLPAGALKRTTDTDESCTFKAKRPK